VEKLLAGIQSVVGFADPMEITLEANPGTAEAVKFKEFRRIGINRLSIGVQSFDDRHLNALGRIHDGRQARSAIESAIHAGFDNFNLDLMHGLPEQDTGSACRDIDIAKNYQPTHLSWYQLTIEPNTHFFSNPPALPAEDTLCDIQEAGLEKLANSYSQYEVSAFSLAGKQSLHNLNYWQFGDYLGIGAGAHGKLTLGGSVPDQGGRRIIRTAKTRVPAHYLRRPSDSFGKRVFLIAEDLPLEFLMNCLRLKEGVAVSLFQERTGLSIDTIGSFLTRNRERGLLVNTARLQTTDLGFRHLDSLLSDLVG
jgi:oxygen-independent coproporphyrinogen-3 oxidase